MKSKLSFGLFEKLSGLLTLSNLAWERFVTFRRS